MANRALKWVGGMLAGVWGALILIGNRSIYAPTKYPRGYWEDRQTAGARDIWLRTEDGVKLHAWWVPIENSSVVTLFLHGNGGNVSFYLEHIRQLTAAGSSVLAPDYRGYGRSEGHPSEGGLYRDADAAFRYLLEAGYAPDQIVLYGQSLGTAVAVDLAARKPVRGVVLEAPFPSISAVADRVIPVLGRVAVWGFDSASKISHVRAPVLVIHGDRDTTVPLELGESLFALAPEPKSFWRVNGAGHTDIPEVAGTEFRKRLSAFYRGNP